MLHPKATIERPPAKIFDTANVIKADQFPTWHKIFVDKLGFGTFFKSALNMRSLETITEWGEKLKRQHRPADLLALPDFMRPHALSKAAIPAPSLSPPAPKFTAPALDRLQVPAPAGHAMAATAGRADQTPGLRPLRGQDQLFRGQVLLE